MKPKVNVETVGFFFFMNKTVGFLSVPSLMCYPIDCVKVMCACSWHLLANTRTVSSGFENHKIFRVASTYKTKVIKGALPNIM